MTYSGRLQMNPNCLKDQELKLMNAFIKRSAFTMKSFCSETKIEKEEKKVFFCQFFSPVHQLFMFLLLKSYWTRDRFVSIQKIGSSCSTSLYFCLVLVFFLFFILFLLFSLRVGQWSLFFFCLSLFVSLSAGLSLFLFQAFSFSLSFSHSNIC